MILPSIPSLIAAKLAYACVFLQLFHLLQVLGHGTLSSPKSRNLLAREKGWDYCPHCKNAGTPSTVKQLDPDHRWNYPETIASSVRHGLCGDAANVPQSLMAGGSLYTGEIGADSTYRQGDSIDIKVWVSTHHHGWFEFYVCDKSDLADPAGRITQACLNKHKLLRSQSDPLNESPIDPEYPGRFYMYPKCHMSLNADGQGYMRIKYDLPRDLNCDHCVLQWWYVTANTCYGGGYGNVVKSRFPNTYSNCIGDGMARGWLPRSDMSICGDIYPEEFWNCADIRILPREGTSPVGSHPTHFPTPIPTSASSTRTNSPQTLEPTSLSSRVDHSYCDYGPDGTGKTSTCDGDKGPARNGGTWCNAMKSRCEQNCNGRWCAAGEDEDFEQNKISLPTPLATGVPTIISKRSPSPHPLPRPISVVDNSLATTVESSQPYCDYGIDGTGTTSTCDGDKGSARNGGPWCNSMQSRCEENCNGRWCTTSSGSNAGN